MAEDNVLFLRCGRAKLVTHHGLAGTGGSGGAAVPDNEKESLGALTVANLNDTDGDGNADNTQDGAAGVVATANGRDELDLMELTVNKPDPAPSGSVTLSVTSGNVKLWKHSTKKEEFALTAGSAAIAVASLPMTLWIEARAVSPSLRHIVIETDYCGAKDVVTATAVWAEKTGFRTSQTTTTMSANADANQNKINVNNTAGLQVGSNVIVFRDVGYTRESHVIIAINGQEITLAANLANAYFANDEVREGVSRLAADNDTYRNNFVSFGGKLGAAHVSPITNNGMEIEFTLKPVGVGDDDRLVVNITRSVEGKRWDNGTEVLGFRRSFPTKVEEGNDDGGSSDEDNTPNQDKVYVHDIPGLTSDVAGADSSIWRYNFYEFLRAKIGGTFNDNGQVEGSRCSDKIPWRARIDVTKDAGGFWQRNGADNKIQEGHEAIGAP